MTTPGRFRLFLVSALLLFLELACIRWLPAHVLFLTFFTNTVLLACFLGMSIGCMVADRDKHYLATTPHFLAVTFGAGMGMEALRLKLERVIDVGHQASPQMVFFGAEYRVSDVARFPVPMEVLAGAFFILVALTFVGLGQEMGREFDRFPDRVTAYVINIGGSIVGVLAFTVLSWLHVPPVVWLALVAPAIVYMFRTHAGIAPGRLRMAVVLLLATVVVTAKTSGPKTGTPPAEHHWSPYYRVEYMKDIGAISVNLIGHQVMSSSREGRPAYDLPYALSRDSGAPPIRDVLIIGAGSGNDVAVALKWNVRHVDAVEIDPVIQSIGAADHPDHPYQDPRVTVHLDDGRDFLRRTDRRYDLVIYALVDSLVLHSSFSNIRLESYLFTSQALSEVKQHLAPQGLFFMYNYFRQGWIISRLQNELSAAFGATPVVMMLPYSATVDPNESYSGFTVFATGGASEVGLRTAFERHDYWIPRADPQGPGKPSGFVAAPPNKDDFFHIGAAQVMQPEQPLRAADDDWPFLYLRSPMIPSLSLRGMALMAGLSLVLIFSFWRAKPGPTGPFQLDTRMFFLGAGFMLVETKAVVTMALTFGSTWMVNSIVFVAVLLMILGANLYVLRRRPQALWPYYAGLLVAFAVNAACPADYFLGMGRAVQLLGSCALVFMPILFAGVVFAVDFRRTTSPHSALAANVAGAILGGLLENVSMLIGFRYLIGVAAILYVLSAWAPRSTMRAAVS